MWFQAICTIILKNIVSSSFAERFPTLFSCVKGDHNFSLRSSCTQVFKSLRRLLKIIDLIYDRGNLSFNHQLSHKFQVSN